MGEAGKAIGEHYANNEINSSHKNVYFIVNSLCQQNTDGGYFAFLFPAEISLSFGVANRTVPIIRCTYYSIVAVNSSELGGWPDFVKYVFRGELQ